jgi:C-terminal processing protease CtpA/Prc
MSIMAEIKLDPDHGLGTVRTMPDFRELTEQPSLSGADRLTLLDQAALLIDTVYVHLLHKRAMYAVEPTQRLRLLRHRQSRLTDAAFHAELLRIFVELRDLHTNYILPQPYQGPFAFLGVLLEQFWQDGRPAFLVSKTFPHLVGDARLVEGAEITHWNGAPIGLAVTRNADREAGSNSGARLARGLESMTLRTLALSPVPDEDWVDVRCLVDGAPHETRLRWRVFDTAADLNGPLPDNGPFAGLSVPSAHLVGLDLRTEVVRQAKKQLFVPAAVDEERRVASEPGDVPEPTAAQVAASEIPTTRPDELRARVVTTAAGTFGHLRIFTFHMKDQKIEAFLNEVVRLLDVLPKNGLILDVRGNGGGFVVAAEFLLQFFTPRPIQPEPMQLISTDATRELCASAEDLAGWLPSVDQAIETGAQYSSALPLYPAEVVNGVGQLYHGPVVLVTDALCYSATDIFAAGFQDHRIGPVLGIDEATGAGGANVWTHQNLVDGWKDGPFRPLPSGAQFRVSLRRCLRVGERAGEPVEDLGVRPDVPYRMTRRDLLEGNADLLERAGVVLAAGTPRRLDAEVGDRTASAVTLSLTTEALTGVDVYVNERPVQSAPLTDHKATLTVPLPAGRAVIRLAGFDGDTLVAARTLDLSS